MECLNPGLTPLAGGRRAPTPAARCMEASAEAVSGTQRAAGQSACAVPMQDPGRGGAEGAAAPRQDRHAVVARLAALAHRDGAGPRSGIVPRTRARPVSRESPTYWLRVSRKRPSSTGALSSSSRLRPAGAGVHEFGRARHDGQPIDPRGFAHRSPRFLPLSRRCRQGATADPRRWLPTPSRKSSANDAVERSVGWASRKNRAAPSPPGAVS
jgi:hypothetical protein